MKRQYIIFAVTLVALSGSLVTVFAARQERDFQLRGYVDASVDSSLPFKVPRLGVNVELIQYSNDILPQQLKQMVAAHITWVRQVFPWDEIEPERGHYRWEVWDHIVETVAKYPSLHLIAVLTYTPSWARVADAQDDHTSPPADPGDFAKFASLFAARYGEDIDYYQVWDEPNLIASWGGLEPRPADYAALLQETYGAIHSADAEATVIAGALAPTIETGPKNISDILFLSDLYALGAQNYMDAVGAKPYGFDESPEDRTVKPNILNFSRVVALREVMVRNGDAAKAIWAMNWGWNSLPDNWAGRPSIWGRVTNAQQVDYTLTALDRTEREWPWLAGMVLQQWQPVAPPDDPIWGFALINYQDQPTPLYGALVQHIPPLQAENGLFPAANPFALYSGVWTFGKMGADIGWVQDSQFDFAFKGRAVSLLLRQDKFVAYLYPTIDGQPADATPKDASGNAYIVLTSGSELLEENLVPVAANLLPSTHSMHIVADRGWDRWVLAGYGVSSGNLAFPYDNKVAIAWIAVAISVASAAVAGWQINWVFLFNRLSFLNRRINAVGQLGIGIVTSLALLVGMLITWGDSTPNLFRRESVQLGLAIFSAGLLYLQPGLILAIVAAIVLFVLIYNHLDIGLILTLFWTPFFLFPVELYRFAFPLSEILILMSAAAWLLRLLVEQGKMRHMPISSLPQTPVFRMRLKGLDYGVIAFVVLGVISLLWAQLHSQATTELRVMIVEPALFYAIFRTIPLDKKLILKLVDALLIAGFVVAIIGLWQFLQGQAVITAEDGARRLASVYGSPNNVGLFLGRCIPFALAFLFAPIDRLRRIAAAVSLGVMGLAIILSQSVGAIFVGVPAAMIAVLLVYGGKRARWILFGLVIIAVVGFLFSLQSARFARVLDFDSGTNFFRIRVWQSALNIIHDHPITGLGLDQFLYAFRGHYILPDAWQEPNLSHPHNIILDFWVRLGIFGVGLLLVIQFAFWKAMRGAIRIYQKHDPLLYAVVVGLIGSMINLISHGLIDNSVFVQDLCYVFIFLLGCAAQLSNTSAIDVPPL
ncbi:MAG: O-antigen ligase family protein [Chloroflexota bacterium]